jgi:hypothetical protein
MHIHAVTKIPKIIYIASMRLARKLEDQLHQHINMEAIQFLDNKTTVRRLKRLKPFELV